MKLDNISFSSPKIICVSRDITCGCPYDIHGIALKLFQNGFRLILKMLTFKTVSNITTSALVIRSYVVILLEALSYLFKIAVT